MLLMMAALRGGNPVAGGSAPAAPSSLTATAVSSSQINLSWTDNSGDETSFIIERSPNGSTSWSQIDTNSANDTTYSNTGLTAETAYYYRVKASNAHGDSSYSNTANDTTDAASDSFGFSTWSKTLSGAHKLADAGKIVPVMPVFEITSGNRTINIPFRRLPGETGAINCRVDTFNTGIQAVAGTHYTAISNDTTTLAFDDAVSGVVFLPLTIGTVPAGINIIGIKLTEVSAQNVVLHTYCWVYINDGGVCSTAKYVSRDTGSDANSGTSGSPWKTMDKGLRSMGSGGGVLYVRESTTYYREYFRTATSAFQLGGVRVEAQQDENSLIVCMPYPGDDVVIDQGASVSSNNFAWSSSNFEGNGGTVTPPVYPAGLWYNGASHVHVTGIKITNCPSNNVDGEALTSNSIYGSGSAHHCVLHNCEVDNLFAEPGNGGLRGLVSLIHSYEFAVSRCNLHDAYDFARGMPVSWNSYNAGNAIAVFAEVSTCPWIAYNTVNKAGMFYMKYPQDVGDNGPHIHHNICTQTDYQFVEAGPYSSGARPMRDWIVHHNVYVPGEVAYGLQISGQQESASTANQNFLFFSNTMIMPDGTTSNDPMIFNNEMANFRSFDNILNNPDLTMRLNSGAWPATCTYADYNCFVDAISYFMSSIGSTTSGLTNIRAITGNSQLTYNNPETNGISGTPTYLGGGDPSTAYTTPTGITAATTGRLGRGIGANEPAGRLAA